MEAIIQQEGAAAEAEGARGEGTRTSAEFTDDLGKFTLPDEYEFDGFDNIGDGSGTGCYGLFTSYFSFFLVIYIYL